MTEAAVQEVQQATTEAVHQATAEAVQADFHQARHLQPEEVRAVMAAVAASAEEEVPVAVAAVEPEDRNLRLKLI